MEIQTPSEKKWTIGLVLFFALVIIILNSQAGFDSSYVFLLVFLGALGVFWISLRIWFPEKYRLFSEYRWLNAGIYFGYIILSSFIKDGVTLSSVCSTILLIAVTCFLYFRRLKQPLENESFESIDYEDITAKKLQ